MGPHDCERLLMRKANLARLLARRPDGISLSDLDQGEIGPDLFRAASADVIDR
jgi:bifunctional non-homologous end joining protein LigD